MTENELDRAWEDYNSRHGGEWPEECFKEGWNAAIEYFLTKSVELNGLLYGMDEIFDAMKHFPREKL